MLCATRNSEITLKDLKFAKFATDFVRDGQKLILFLSQYKFLKINSILMIPA